MSLPAVATTESVAVAWMRSLAGLDGLVGTTLPTTLPDDGFVTVAAIPIAADVDVPQRGRGYVQADTWAAPKSGSAKPPWARANLLAETILRGTFSMRHGATVELRPGVAARLQSVYATTEPERITSDPGGFARYRFDLAVDWVRL